jgi:hypothetical protein
MATQAVTSAMCCGNLGIEKLRCGRQAHVVDVEQELRASRRPLLM